MVLAISFGILTAWLGIIWGDVVIRILQRLNLGTRIRIRGAAAVVSYHMAKAGTPKFGGLLVILSVVFVQVLINLANVVKGNLEGLSILVPLGALVLYGILGAIDDWEGTRGLRKGEGISRRAKFGSQLLLALVFAFALHHGLDLQSVAIPFIPFRIELGAWYLLIAVFVIVATSNAVNITDGLDGLAGNQAAMAFAAYGIIAFFQGQIYLTIFCFVMVGGLFGFLWFNAHPARVFMGDTGSLPFGAVLAIVAFMTGQWLLLPVVAFVFVMEAVTDLMQLAYFAYTERRYGERRRIFPMCPIHHTFELLGWSEQQIVYRFMFVSILTAMIGVALAIV
ncbi:MAG TPA: phospho-N-acetylmuramoyl-pentapeptide-transferase [Anaerolineales bacterium]|nr:phospho-N-acetylmuramoyl-pentapeptide-transferase [Anaerolineales bacterium]